MESDVWRTLDPDVMCGYFPTFLVEKYFALAFLAGPDHFPTGQRPPVGISVVGPKVVIKGVGNLLHLGCRARVSRREAIVWRDAKMRMSQADTGYAVCMLAKYLVLIHIYWITALAYQTM